MVQMAIFRGGIWVAVCPKRTGPAVQQSTFHASDPQSAVGIDVMRIDAIQNSIDQRHTGPAVHFGIVIANIARQLEDLVVKLRIDRVDVVADKRTKRTPPY